MQSGTAQQMKGCRQQGAGAGFSKIWIHIHGRSLENRTSPAVAQTTRPGASLHDRKGMVTEKGRWLARRYPVAGLRKIPSLTP
jgi:hypothetical protein